MPAELGTTNLLLGIMAVVSVLEALVIIGIGIAGFAAYRKSVALINTLEARHVAPAMARVNVILDEASTILVDVKAVVDNVQDVTARVKQETERVDDAINATIDRMDNAAYRVGSHVRAKATAVVGFVRGLRAALEAVLRSRYQTERS